MNCKISPDLEVLESLHQKYGWVPGPDNIRPSKELVLKKEIDLQNADNFYVSMKDYMYDLVFNFPTQLNSDGKLIAIIPKEMIKIFRENDYPYILPENTYHFIMWYNTDKKMVLDEEINQDIDNGIRKITDNQYSFVWYENPNMSVPDIYHVQVFFKIKN